MSHVNVDGAQNVEVSKPIPCERTPSEQLALMEAYTQAHRAHSGGDKARREVECLKVIYPALFRHMEPADLIAGRLDFLPIGFGSVTSVGGVGHYCVFHKLRAFKQLLATDEERARVDALYDYWQDHDTKSLYCQDVLGDATTGFFMQYEPPLMATARLSGMMLDYTKLMRLGVGGLIAEVDARIDAAGEKDGFLRASRDALVLFQQVIDREVELVHEAMVGTAPGRMAELELMAADLGAVREAPPQTFHQALQLFWLYALCAGCINYGRLDVVLGPFLAHDLEEGTITRDEAHAYVKSLWTMIENRRTTVNGRVIVGGQGRPDPGAADEFARICLEVCKECRYVEPQFTLRFDHETPADIRDMALDAIGAGATYPTLYNDDVEVPAVEYGMRVSHAEAEQYVPFGCTEFVIQGRSVGTPNTLINLLKILQMSLEGGVDPYDGVDKGAGVAVLPLERLTSFDVLLDNYHRLLDRYMDLAVADQAHSYEVMNHEVSFLFTSILMDGCLSRGRALLDGGVEILGGSCETYGNINSSDALWAMKTLVFDEGRYTLRQVVDAMDDDFRGPGEERLRLDLWHADKYGNDLDGVDGMANDLYEYVAKGIRDRGIRAGLGYFLIVISNNQTNTDWGHMTAASPDGRHAGLYLNPANNPQGGAATSGPTAMLNSLARFDARYHAGSVQNIKFTPRMFNHDRKKVKVLFDTYFRRGGCQLMVTVCDRGQLEDAQVHPERYPDLIVRVAGYSAVFVDLPRDVQDEVISRTLWDE
ncbi:MAG: pyruvate formate lyase family protein [Atopobiaceae bacterium]|jgi:pyruvate-formate lyase|nr:pyruvate formate lyase family protein [Atopobiaceae bacterium]MCH4181167.1 pyruvate formate lyase family protein [Atopobiaceae bacterium]MCH4215167.1 pyruvate formate lyase family protein [Atopobiaceae bacterium]MCH4277020.1 pyruvate formate lyase family protein [Atopobiaceae bacterium]MCI1226132.1 pyruvate formate lyase family protein [Atopobiaceae bacterium]